MSVAELLFPNRYRRKVLALLTMNPNTSIHLRELARLTTTSPGTLKKELDLLATAGLVKSKAQGNQVQFCINTEHPIYPELFALIRKTTGLRDVLAAALKPLANQLEVAFVFGSMAKEAETSHSDIDVLIIGDVTFGQINNALFDAQTVLSREINPKVMSRHDWTRKRQVGSTFVKDIVSKPKIFIIGSDNDL